MPTRSFRWCRNVPAAGCLSLLLAATSAGQPPLRIVPESRPPALQLRPDPSADDTAAVPRRATLAPLRFHGVQIGESTVEEVTQAWGTPRATSPDAGLLQQTYQLEPFARIEASFVERRILVATIVLAELQPVAAVARQLQLDQLRPLELTDAQGELRGWQYPERGVSLWRGEGSGPDEVAQIVLDCLDPAPFVTRGRLALAEHPSRAIEDAELALEVDPRSSNAQRLKGTAQLAAGEYHEALDTVSLAIVDREDEVESHLLRSRIYVALGEREPAATDAQQALRLAGDRPLHRAQALVQLAEIASRGPSNEAAEALELYQAALPLVESLRDSTKETERRAATDVALAAHLGMARTIAAGSWKNKTVAATKWLERAQGIVRDQLGVDGPAADAALFEVCCGALETTAGLEGQVDPRIWVERGRLLAPRSLERLDDPLAQQALAWRWGCALDDAAQACQRRGEQSKALEYGDEASVLFERVVELRDVTPLESYRVARLHYRLGAIHAVQDGSHRQALPWFEKARPTLEQPLAQVPGIDPGQAGETLVSMAVTYWALGEQDRALELTRRGTRWMEQAVDQGTLERGHLKVPYANLVRMHRHRGESRDADTYETLAQRLEARTLR